MRGRYRERDRPRERRFFELLLGSSTSSAEVPGGSTSSAEAAFAGVWEAHPLPPRDTSENQAGPIIIRVLKRTARSSSIF